MLAQGSTRFSLGRPKRRIVGLDASVWRTDEQETLNRRNPSRRLRTSPPANPLASIHVERKRRADDPERHFRFGDPAAIIAEAR